MKNNKGVILAVLFIILFSSSVYAASIDAEIKKITNYAEDYETGNINYVQFLVYSSAVREKMNEILGATGREMGGILKEEQMKSVLGEATEETKWVWVENEEREKKMDKAVPAWRKIIFDGNKIQVWLNSWPSIFSKKNETLLIYRLNFEIRFKEPQEELNVKDKIPLIKELAEQYNKNPTRENAEKLARESVNVEKTFEAYMQQNQGKCEDVLKSIMGTESKLWEQKMLAYDIDFFSGKNFDVRMKLEMCDECEWNWINLDFWFEGRGPGFKEPEQKEVQAGIPEKMEGADYKKEIINVLDEIKQALNANDFSKAVSLKTELWKLNEAWNQKSNDVWKEIGSIFESKRQSMTPEQQQEYSKNYGWIRDEQVKREKEKEIRKKNYNERKEFYLSLFNDYEKKESYFSQIEYEKRLVEEFMEFGKEICDNNLDDNRDEKADCSDSQCSGKICGKQTINTADGNETREEVKNLFCIQGTCQLKEEIIEIKEAACGNHICEGNETESCKKDCVQCIAYEAINCSGRVIFRGHDENNCPLEPICLEENNSCQVSSDCIQPLCGRAECAENTCQIITLEECRESECADGEEKRMNCNNGARIISETCVDGVWRDTGIDCAVEVIGGNETREERKDIIEEPTAGNECQAREDCGNMNDVCSNGRCITLPEAVRVEPIETRTTQQEQKQETPAETNERTSEQQEQTQTTSQETTTGTTQQEQTITGQVISAIKIISGKVTGFIISGFDVEERWQTAPQETSGQTQTTLREEQGTQDNIEHPQQPMENQEQPRQEGEERRDEERRDDRGEEDRGRREQEDRGRQEENCKQGCENPCRDMLIAPCVDKCVRESSCKDEACTDEKIKSCESKCKQEKNFENCIEECSGKCMKGEGENFRIDEQREEPKMEKGVFKLGGACRTAQGNQKTEAFIYFDGWGKPFDELRYIKNKYYSGGQADWCKRDLNNIMKQRKEFESGFNQEFVDWFFGKYLANSADEWEQHVSGIFELYWKDVEMSREMAFRMQCLEKKEIPAYNLIQNIKYESDYGKLEFWEEIKSVKLPGMEEEVQVISPYMKVWIFPPKSFIISEMKSAMKNHEFPGKPEDKIEREKQEGPTEQEKAEIKKDSGFMNQIKDISGKYGGNLDAAVQFKDYETGETVFNLYVQVNENDIIKMTPMLPEEMKEKDVAVEINFADVYEIISSQEKEMQGGRLESPPWDKKMRPAQKVKEIVNGVGMYFKVRGMINNAKVEPKENEKEIRKMVKSFFSIMKKGGDEGKEMGGENMGEEKMDEKSAEDGVWENKEKITGEVIAEI